jgi:hypothetical protein
MLSQTELKAFSSEINLDLLNDVVAFVRDTSEADRTQKRNILQEGILLTPNTSSSAFQKKYGFLYLGELLERYELRFKCPIQDFRAIALALGYTRDLVTDSMVVGSQKADFIRRLKRRAENDFYLMGALYLLSRSKGNDAVLESKLIEAPDSTEKLIFILSLLPNFEHAFPRVQNQLLCALSAKRTMPVLGNMKIFSWLIENLIPFSKQIKGKDVALFRALATLPTSFIKPGSKHHTVLLECGYSSLEIAYMNTLSVLMITVPDTPQLSTVVIQKMVVSLFREVFANESALPSSVYEQLSEIFRMYYHFRPRCYGVSLLSDALKEAPLISTPETFRWFAGLTNVQHPVLRNFDILNTKWDGLVSELDSIEYRYLFEISLSEKMDAADIQKRLDRYEALTGTSYLAIFRNELNCSQFSLLVKKELVNLWQLFQESLDGDGNVKYPHMLTHIRLELCGISTIYAYQFYEKFIEQYGIQGLKHFWPHNYSNSLESLFSRTGYSHSVQDTLTLTVQRDFLDETGEQRLFQWLEAYVFAYDPKIYLSLTVAALQHENIMKLFPIEQRKALFQMVIALPDLAAREKNALKKKYLTAEELQAEQDAKKAAELEAKRQRNLEIQEDVRSDYDSISSGTVSDVWKFLDRMEYRFEKQPMANRIVYEHLSDLVFKLNQEATSHELSCFFLICAKLVDQGNMDFEEAKNYICKIGEGDGNADGSI